MKYTLVVVDMQPHAWFASVRNLAAVKREILRAMDNDCPIVFTQSLYWDSDDPPLPDVHKELREMVKGYKYFVDTVGKNCSDASLHIKNFCEPKIVTAAFVLVGCNSDACVMDTAVGLRRFYPESGITVVKDACDTISKDVDPWACYADHPTIRLQETTATPADAATEEDDVELCGICMRPYDDCDCPRTGRR